ncbi:hypothetical protein IGL98_003474 [Enterococcus sp. DIV0840]|uniref:hypothetical protein n=1 Tax=Enterococcus TaxID=1350 RepID=UPI001A8E12EB|nr:MULTISPECIES: hypothetical protein [Enterococcus]MBO0435938.1 hypothetical protein [Enterococcus sp. DIV0849a]MBO0473769.1 hypothetical protein [Enterococcus ureasiticus]
MKKFYFHDLIKYFILTCIFLTGYFIFTTVTKTNTDANNVVSNYPVKASNNITKIEYSDSIDAFYRVKNDFIFKTYKDKSQKKILFETKSDNYFDYKAQKKMEKDFGLEQMIKLNVVGNENKHLSRQPSYGVSIDPKVKGLSVNGKKVDKVFDYEYNGHVFYIWYFKDFEISLDKVNTEEEWDNILITFS